MRNSFNLLLIALALCDNTYVFFDILDKNSAFHTNLYIMMFPYFLYPFKMMAMTGSILLTVTIAIERYVAVHYPINFRQAMASGASALRKRVATYLIPVLLICILFNVTKLFEISYMCRSTDFLHWYYYNMNFIPKRTLFTTMVKQNTCL